jgi:hypothetical protein
MQFDMENGHWVSFLWVDEDLIWEGRQIFIQVCDQWITPTWFEHFLKTKDWVLIISKNLQTYDWVYD